jgi:hypothetical protein
MANPLCFSSWAWLRTTPLRFNSWPFTKMLGLVLKQDDPFQKFNHPDLLSEGNSSTSLSPWLALQLYYIYPRTLSGKQADRS